MVGTPKDIAKRGGTAVGPLFLVYHEGLRTARGTKVLKARQYTTCLKAEEIIRKANEAAEEITARGRTAFAEEKARGYREGLREGKMQLAEQMVGTAAATARYLAEFEEKAVELVISALRKIVGEMNPAERIVQVVRNVLTFAKNQPQVSLRVCPAEADSLNASLNDIMTDFPAIRFIDVVSDGRLKEGGCILETEMGVVDAGVDVQIEAIRRALTNALKRK